MSAAIIEAEADFEQTCGNAFDAQTYALVAGFVPFVDSQGWLNIYARERTPVTAVTALQYRYRNAPTWQTLTWGADDIVLPPLGTADGYPHPDSGHVQIYPAPLLGQVSTGLIMVRWSYAAGFASNAIPQNLTNMIAEAAAYVYKRREVPFGVIQNGQLGTFSRPMNYPPDIMTRFRRWSTSYA